MASDFPAYVAYNHEDYDVGQFTIDAANAGKAGSLCTLNVGDNEIDECATPNPALILGLMTGPYTARTIYPASKMPVIILSDNVVVAMCSATTPADSHISDSYDIAKLASGNWALVATTVGPRVVVKKVDATAGIFYVTFLAANLQGDSVVS